MFAFLISDLANLDFYLGQPLLLLMLGFQIWMLVDAIRRQEWIWAVFIFFFSILSALLYFFFVYRQERAAASPMRGFELPGAHDRRRIKELQDQIHHLDKAHHHSQLGDIYLNQGKLQQAAACYRAALERDPEDLDTRAHYGHCLLRMNRPADAREYLEKVCAENPKHDYGHSLMALAETYAALGDADAAIATWRRALENNSYARARVQLAELLLARQQVDEAAALLKEVVADDAHAPAFQRKQERGWVNRARHLLGRIK